MKISFRCIWRSFRYKKLRTALTVASIAIGVFSVVVICTISGIGKQAFNAELESLGADGVVITTKKTAETRLANADFRVVREDPTVQAATPLMMTLTDSILKNESTEVTLLGIHPDAEQVVRIDCLHGRTLTPADISNTSRVCLIDKTLAEAVYKRQNVVGKEIRLLINASYETFEIVGVVSSGGNVLKSLTGEYVPSFVYVPYTTMQLYKQDSSIETIAVKFVADSDIGAHADALIETLEQQNETVDSFQYTNIAQQKETLNRLLDILTLVLSAIGLVSVVVAGIGIMTIMMVAVSERTKEIGVKKAVGAGRLQIMLEFMLESFLIALIGSLVGGGLGQGILYVTTRFVGISMTFDVGLLLSCVAGALVLAIAFGVYPAYMASKLNPVDALQQE